MRSHLRTILAGLLTAGLLWFFLRNAHLSEVWREIRAARVDYLAAGVAVTALTYVLRAIRWQYLLRPIGAVHFSAAFRATVIGFAATSVLPARAGEFLRPYLLAREEGVSATAAFATVIFERLLDLVMVLLLLGAFVWVFDPGMARIDGGTFEAVKAAGAAAAGAATLALAITFILAGHPERLSRWALRIERIVPPRAAVLISRLVHRFAQGLAVIRQPGPLLMALAWSLPVWLSIAFGIALVSWAFQVPMPFSGAFLLTALLVVGVSVPTPGAVGGFHAAYQIGVTMFYGVAIDRAVGAAIVLHAISFVPVTVAGFAFMARDGLTFRRMHRLRVASEAGAPTALAVPSHEEGLS